MRSPFWPEITDVRSASGLARQGTWAALFVCGGSIVLGLLPLLDEPRRTGPDSVTVVSGLVFGVIAIGIWLRLRTAAVLGLLLFTAGSAITALSRVGPWNPLLAFFLFLSFVNSVRGTFAWRRYLRQPIGARRGRGLAFVMFAVLREIRSVRRRIFGDEIPHWVVDLSPDFLKHLNVLQLLPTIWAILFFPAHFFFRVPRIVHHPAPYRTPIGFFRHLIVLTVAVWLFLWLNPWFDHGPDIAQAALLAASLALPVLLPVIGVAFWCLCAPLGFVLRYSGFYINSAHFLTLVDFRVYRDLRWSRRSWGLIYFLGYALTVPQIAFLVAGAVMYLAFDRTGVPAANPVASPEYLMLGLVLLLDWVFIVPYCELLRVLGEFPTRRMLRSDVQRLAAAAAHAEYLLNQYEKAQDHWYSRRDRKRARLYKILSQVLDGGMRDAWLALRRRLHYDRRMELELRPDQLARFRSDRAAAYSNAAFTRFARAWDAFEPGRDARFAFVEEMSRSLRAITGAEWHLAPATGSFDPGIEPSDGTMAMDDSVHQTRAG